MDRRREILDLHPADGDRIKVRQRGLDQSVGGLERHGPRILTDIDVELPGHGAGNHRIAGAGVDHEFGGGFPVEGSLDHDNLAMLLNRDGSLSHNGGLFCLWTPRILFSLDPIGCWPLLFWDIVQVISEMDDAVLIDPAVVFRR